MNPDLRPRAAKSRRSEPAGPVGGGLGGADRWTGAVLFVVLAAVVITLSQLAFAHLSPAITNYPVPRPALPRHLAWLGAWAWWDGAWYVDIARRGYSFTAGPQSPVAFFPLYPLVIRAVALVVGHPALAGFLITLGGGLAATVGFHRWCHRWLDRRRATIAVGLLLLYPCSFYLTGAVYADALFLATAIGAFLALETDRPVAAGLLGALATATRPTGIFVAIGLWLRAIERRRRARTDQVPSEDDQPPGRRRPSMAGLVLAPAGLIAYCSYLGWKFGNPLAFAAAEKAWGQAPGFQTWLKVAWFKRILHAPFFSTMDFHLIGSAAVTVLAVAMLPRVWRRFGPAYGVFAALMVLVPALSTRDFVGMGRYLLAAFPCFAAAGDALADSPRLVVPVLVASGSLMLFFAQLHARNMLIS